jgi:hypothetical protein
MGWAGMGLVLYKQRHYMMDYKMDVLGARYWINLTVLIYQTLRPYTYGLTCSTLHCQNSSPALGSIRSSRASSIFPNGTTGCVSGGAHGSGGEDIPHVVFSSIDVSRPANSSV